jgi:hypothetical protein
MVSAERRGMKKEEWREGGERRERENRGRYLSPERSVLKRLIPKSAILTVQSAITYLGLVRTPKKQSDPGYRVTSAKK